MSDKLHMEAYQIGLHCFRNGRFQERWWFSFYLGGHRLESTKQYKAKSSAKRAALNLVSQIAIGGEK